MNEKISDLICRFLFFLLSLLIFLSNIPFEIITYADDTNDGYRANEIVEANTSVNAGGGTEVVVNAETDVRVNANHRSLAILDTAKMVNVNNTQKSDYKPANLKSRLGDIFPEYNFADITEYEGFQNEVRDDVYAGESETVADYKYKLEYLINNNIINRTTDYIYDGSRVYMGTGRTVHASLENDYNFNSNTNISNNIDKPRYYDPTLRISKTDFLTELMKIGGIKESRIIAVQTNYRRTDENLRTVEVTQEPIELSPYQDKMGELGIDTVNNDIVADHGVFGQLNLLVTNDVTEAYLYEALNKGLISKNELGGVEGEAFLSLMPSGEYTPPGAWFDDEPLRQSYNLVKAETALEGSYSDSEGSAIPSDLHNKMLATDDDGNVLASYPKDIKDYLDIVYDSVEQVETTDGLEYPWGNSYYYSVDACLINNPTSETPTEIIKRFSSVDVSQGLQDMVKYEATGGENGGIIDNGYQYFTDENITLAQAYVLASKFMKVNGEEPHINQKEIDYINSMYSLDFNGLLADEIEAVQYLIAKGVLDPLTENIAQATSTQLTNDIAVDLLYRIANPNYRCSFTPNLTDEESMMLNHGYAKTTVSVESSGTGASVEKLPITYKSGNGSSTTTVWNTVKTDRIHNPGNYDYLYVRMPDGVFTAETTDGVTKYNTSARVVMLVDDEYRTVIDPYNARLNGGVREYLIPEMRRKIKDVTDSSGATHPVYDIIYEADGVTPATDEDGYIKFKTNYLDNVRGDLGEAMHQSIFCYRDLAGNYWVRYIVNKNSSSNVRLQITYDNGGKVDEYTGFNGEGAYYLSKAGDKVFTKLSLTDAETSSITNVQGVNPESNTAYKDTASNTLYNQVISIDVATRRYLGDLGENLKHLLSDEDIYDINGNVIGTNKYLTVNTFTLNAAIPTETPKTVSVITKEYVDVKPTVADIPETGIIRASSTSKALKNILLERSKLLDSRDETVTVKTRELNVDAQLGTILIGPMNEPTLEELLLDGVNLITRDDSGNFAINNSGFNNKLAYLSYISNMSVVKAEDDGYYYVQYTAQGTDVRTEFGFIYDAFNVGLSSDTSIHIPGFARYNATGDEVVLISQNEIETWSTDSRNSLSVEVISDKMLYNNYTAQRAFINTDEHFTMIGNNITRYSDDTVMVNKFGEEVFYNLDVIIELFADINAVSDKMGTQVSVTTNKTNCMSDDANYRLVDVYDTYSGNADLSENTITKVDKTYVLEDSGNIYVCLSALSDRASNMIYFKDTTHSGLEWLVIYYPKVTDGVLKHATQTNNGVIASMSNNSGDPSSGASGLITSVNTTFEPDTKVLSAYLFSGGGGSNLNSVYSGKDGLLGMFAAGSVSKAASEVLPSGYQYDMYLLGTNGETTPNETVWTDFVSIFQDVTVGGRSGLDLLNNCVMDETMHKLFEGSREFSQENFNATNITINFLPTVQKANEATTAGDGYYVFRDLASHNLYFRLVNSNGSTNQYKYAMYFKNRLYAEADSSGQCASTYSNGKIKLDSPAVMFNQQRYYYKTPEGMVPLELYSNGDVGAGLLKDISYDNIISKVMKEGQILNSATDKFKVQILYNGRNSAFVAQGQKDFNGNILEPFRATSSASSDVALFTPVRSKKSLIYGSTDDSSATAHLFEDLAKYLNTGSCNIGSPVTMLDYFDAEMAYTFEHEYCGGSTTASNFVDSNGTAYWSPFAARDYVTYSANQRQKATDALFNASLAGIYECTWDFFDGKAENQYTVDSSSDQNKNTTSTFFTDGNLKTFNDGGSKCFYVMTIGTPFSDYTSLTPSYLPNHKGKYLSNELTSVTKYDEDDPMICFSLCQMVNNTPLVRAIAGIPLEYLQITNGDNSIKSKLSGTVTEEDVVKYLFDTAWGYDNRDNIYYNHYSDLDLITKINNLVTAKSESSSVAHSLSYDRLKSLTSLNYLPIYYQPTFAVPAGTTVVTGNGTLRTFLSDKIRSEINYLSDINNGILAKYLLSNYADVTYLCQVPENSKIVFTNNDGSSAGEFYKLGSSDGMMKKGVPVASKLDWIPTVIYEAPSAGNRNSGSYVKYSDVNDYTLAYKVYRGLYNIEVPTMSSQSLSGNSTGNGSGSKIKLGSTLGNGIWRLPTIAEFKSLAKAQETILDNVPAVWVYPNNFKEIDNDTKTGSKTYIKKGSNGQTVYKAEALRFERNKSKTDYVIDTSITNQGVPDSAKLFTVVNMPPTLVVEEDENNPGTYVVQFYVNPELFGMDMNNKYIAYLQSRDTPAEDIAAALDQSRSSNYDGYMFKVSAFITWLENLLNSIWMFIRYIIPLIIIILWLITTCLYGAVHYLPITHYFLNIWNDRLGFDIVSFLTCGVLGCNRTTRFSHYVVYSCLMWTAAMLIYSTLLQSTLLGAWTFFMENL